MQKYIDRLMMCGFNAVQAFEVVRSFSHEREFDELEEFVTMMEGYAKCRECPYGKNTTIILLVEEGSGIVPSER
jgi:hypothetical protein